MHTLRPHPRSALRLLLLLACVLLPVRGHAQAIDRGREADVLRLLLPFVDDGPVGATVLHRIAIGADNVTLEVTEPGGQTAAVTLTPRPQADASPGSRSFRIALSPAATPQLGQAQLLLRAAVERNDDGTFFAHASILPARAPPPPVVAALLPLALVVANLLWLLLLAVLAVRMWRDRRPRRWLAWLLLATLAAALRRQVPFVPLHANGHGLEEILVAIGAPDSQAATLSYVTQYGPTWLTPLRSLTWLLGQTHDQLAVGSAALGGLATTLAVAAAWRLSRQWLWTALAATLMLLVPVATRVGHSESAFVVAQLLVALGLWLATWPDRLAAVALALVLALLALGHPVGTGLAAGVFLLALAMALQRGEPAAKRALPLLAVLGVAVALELTLTRSGVAARLTQDGHWHLPLPTVSHAYWLWLQPGYAPRVAALALLPGLWAFGRGRAGLMRWLTPAVALSGAALVAATGLMVGFCVTDCLRYQAPFAPVAVLLVAGAGQGLPTRLAGRLVALALWLSIAVELPALDGGRQLDAQGQAYVALRQALSGLHGDVWLVAPDRAAGHEQVVVQMPAGQLVRDGANLRTMLVADVRAPCAAGRKLPQQAFVWLDNACAGRVAEGQPQPCASVLPLAGETLHEAQLVALPPPSLDAAMRGEFNGYPPGRIRVRLARAQCPKLPSDPGGAAL